MSSTTSIEWTRGDDGRPGRTWNPVTGCTKVSPGCKHCYAEAVANRFWKTRQFTDIFLHADRLDEPLRWRKPARIFVNSMSDLFHEDIPIGFIAQIFDRMACATPECGRRHDHEEECWTGPPHTFQILTKRPERMLQVLRELPDYAGCVMHGESPLVTSIATGRWPLPNVHLGVSVEDQTAAGERIPLLLQAPAAVRWISAEPLLGPVNLRGIWNYCPEHDFTGGFCMQRRHPGVRWLDWVVVGGESGPKASPCDIAWIRSIVDQCQAARVPVFVKQLGRAPFDSVNRKCVSADGEPLRTEPWHLRMSDRKGGDPSEWPADLRVREWPEVRA